MYTQADANRNKVTKRCEQMQIVVAAHGTTSIHIRNLIQKWMREDLRKGKEREYKLRKENNNATQKESQA